MVVAGTTKKRPKKQRCCFTQKSKCLISISSTWYCLFIVLIHVYLIKNQLELVLSLSATLSSTSSSLSSSPWKQTDNNTNRTSSSSSSFTTHETSLLDLLDLFRADSRQTQLIVRLCFLSLSTLFLALFLICSLQKCANYANDSVKFGRDFFAEQLHHHRKHVSQVCVCLFQNLR